MMKKFAYCLALMLCLVSCGKAKTEAPEHEYTQSELAKQRLSELVTGIYSQVKSLSAKEVITNLVQANGKPVSMDEKVFSVELNILGLSVRGSVDLNAWWDPSLAVYDGDTLLATIGVEMLPYTQKEILLPTLVFRFEDGTSVSWNTFLIDLHDELS